MVNPLSFGMAQKTMSLGTHKQSKTQKINGAIMNQTQMNKNNIKDFNKFKSKLYQSFEKKFDSYDLLIIALSLLCILAFLLGFMTSDFICL